MRRGRRPAAALSPTHRPRLPSSALPSTMNSGTHQPKIIHWWLLSLWRVPGKYCDKALMNYNLSNLVFCPLLLILSGISLSWLLCAGLWTGYPEVWHLTPEFLRSGRVSSVQEVSPYSRDETESCRSGNSSFTSLIDSLHSLCFPSSNVKIKKKKEILPPFIVEYALPLLPHWM